jgi:hypothetical protein
MHDIVYGNLRIEILTDVGSRLERTSLQRVTPRLLGRQPTGPAHGELQTLLGREEELDQVRLAIQAGKPIELIAGCGFGKTGLLRQLAAVDGGEDLARPWVYLRLGKERLDDTLHRLFEASYTSPQPFKPMPEQRAQLLGQVNSVFLLDDLTVGAGEVGQLVANLASATVIVASTRPVLGRHGTSVNLPGLSDAAAEDLVAGDLGRPLTAAEKPAVRALAQAVGGQPLHLHQAAALAREDGRSLEELATRAARDPQVLDRLSVNALAEQDRRVLAVLALAGGALLPRELIAAVGDVATIAASLGLLRQRGLIEQEQDRFGLPICHVNAYRELLLQYLQLGGALGTMSDWLVAKDPTSDEARSAIGGAVNAIGYAAEHGRYGCASGSRIAPGRPSAATTSTCLLVRSTRTGSRRGGARSASGCGGWLDGGRCSPAGRPCSASRSCSGWCSCPAARPSRHRPPPPARPRRLPRPLRPRRPPRPRRPRPRPARDRAAICPQPHSHPRHRLRPPRPTAHRRSSGCHPTWSRRPPPASAHRCGSPPRRPTRLTGSCRWPAPRPRVPPSRLAQPW